jgi:hypothetical protein
MFNDKTLVDKQIEAPGVVVGLKPEFSRLPRSGERCPFTGLSRSGLNSLILPCPANNFHPPVRSVSLRKRGQIKGVRLIVFQSLMDFLYAHQDTPSE